MSNRVSVDSQDLSALETSLETAGSEFVENYKKLVVIMEDITNGNIKGELATTILEKFENKKPDLDKLKEEIETAREYAKDKGAKLNAVTDSIVSLLR